MEAHGAICWPSPGAGHPSVRTSQHEKAVAGVEPQQATRPSASANGQFMQGLKKPGNDLSRGCTAEDIVNTMILTVLQSAL
jgi:hypothetical protein